MRTPALLAVLVSLVFAAPASGAYSLAKQWGSGAPSTADGQFYGYMWDIEVHNQLGVLVYEQYTPRVQKFDLTGSFLSKFGSEGTGDGQFGRASIPSGYAPGGLAIGKDRSVYVGDSAACRVQKFSSTGTFLKKWGSCDASSYQNFPYLAGVATNSNDEVLVLDGSQREPPGSSVKGQQVKVFTNEGVLTRGFARMSSEQPPPNGFIGPSTDLAAGPSGLVYIADGVNNLIHVFDVNGDYVKRFGGTGTGQGQFQALTGIDVDDTGNVFVVDRAATTVSKFKPDGTFVERFGGSPMGSPRDVAVDSDGGVYVVGDPDYKVYKFTTGSTGGGGDNPNDPPGGTDKLTFRLSLARNVHIGDRVVYTTVLCGVACNINLDATFIERVRRGRVSTPPRFRDNKLGSAHLKTTAKGDKRKAANIVFDRSLYNKINAALRRGNKVEVEVEGTAKAGRQKVTRSFTTQAKR